VSFVDIHSHVLHGLDDGAKSLDESLAMLAMAAADGVTDIVATPHANSRYPFDPALIDERLKELDGRSPIRVHRGCDFRLQPDTIEDALAHPEKYAINGRTYLLVEFPELSVFSHTEHVLQRLLDVGLAPVITHPERHRTLPGRHADLARWIQLGCYVQVTAGSFTGLFGQGARSHAYALLERGLVHLVASDAHDTTRRPPLLSGAYQALAAEWGEEETRPLFVDNPRAVVDGEPIDTVTQPRRRQRKRWYQFWG
jgi:protein-tyrosine phosphatase